MRASFFSLLILLLPALVMAQEAAPRTDSLPGQIAALDQAAAHYRGIVAQGGWPAFPSGPTLHPDDQDARIMVLRDILLKTGDFTGYPAQEQPQDATFYDPLLAEAVRHFQTRHALEADGVIGAQTQKALAVPADKRLAQLVLNIERIRQFMQDHPLTQKAVLVNIAAYRLSLVQENGTLQNMRAIIGRSDRRTPLLVSKITNVHFNPSWNVPAKIATKDLLPKIRKDPEFLHKGGYTVKMDDEEIDLSTFDPEEFSAHPGRFHLRQSPGEDNALGRIKFTFPNNEDVYLHSTSHPALFKKAARNLSSGCVRVEDPRLLAHYVLDNNTHPAKTVDAYYDSSAQRSLSARQSIPLYLLYWTAWTDLASGMPEFYPDIYGKDAADIERIMRSEGFPALPAAHPAGV